MIIEYSTIAILMLACVALFCYFVKQMWKESQEGKAFEDVMKEYYDEEEQDKLSHIDPPLGLMKYIKRGEK